MKNKNIHLNLPCNGHKRRLNLKTLLRKPIQLISRFIFSCLAVKYGNCLISSVFFDYKWRNFQGSKMKTAIFELVLEQINVLKFFSGRQLFGQLHRKSTDRYYTYFLFHCLIYAQIKLCVNTHHYNKHF